MSRSGGGSGGEGAALPTADTETGEYVATYEEPLDTPTVERDGEPLFAFDVIWFACADPETEVRG